MPKMSTDVDGPLLDVRNLKIHIKSFEGLAEIVDDVCFNLNKREVIALVGETGCGKSLTAKAILGVLPSNAEVVGGEVLYKGVDLLKLSERDWRSYRGKELSMIPQNPMVSLNPLLTVGEQLMDLICLQDQPEIALLPYYIRRKKLKKEKKAYDKAIKILEDVALKPAERVMRSYPFQISGGMAQRVCIAMALLGNPSGLMELRYLS